MENRDYPQVYPETVKCLAAETLNLTYIIVPKV